MLLVSDSVVVGDSDATTVYGGGEGIANGQRRREYSDHDAVTWSNW